ncbi:MAG: HDOD domain-containing protein [Lentisphaerota bacterium]
MSQTLEEVIRVAAHSDISSIQNIVSRIMEVIQSPKSNAIDLKNLIEIDPPLASRVLKLANSAYYGMKRRMGEILDAIVCIGFEAVKELALSQKVCELFHKDVLMHGYSRSAIWMHSICVAQCGKMIYRREFRLPGDDIYTLGLLHDLGIIVEDQFLRKEFTQILERRKKEKKDLIETEMAVLGYCHEDIARRLTEEWHFPDVLCKTIGYAERPRPAPEEYSRLAKTLYLSNYACRKARLGYNECHRETDEVYYECLKAVDIKEKSLSLIMVDVDKTVRQMQRDGWF